MFLLTTRRADSTPQQGEQLTTDQWLSLIYGTAQPTTLPAPEVLSNSANFYRTWTAQLQEYAPSVVQIPLMLTKLTALEVLIDNFTTTYDCSDMSEHYNKFFIPKRSSGMREINAPKDYLMDIMYDIKRCFESSLKVQYHDQAYAYIKGRGTKDDLIEHQSNKSRWFLKLDVKDFFPSCNATFIKAQLKKLYPFQQLFNDELGERVLDKVIALSILGGGLPQGTPLSPMLTNLMMLPIDFALNKKLYQFNNQHYVYTRYADDLQISCEYNFDWTLVQTAVEEVLIEQDAPFRIKQEKTRYGSSSGSNWNLGLMLNKDNNITLGYKQKQRLRAGINNFLRDFTNGMIWSRIDVQRLIGNLSYLRNIEQNYCEYIISELETKYSKNFKECTTQILRS